MSDHRPYDPASRRLDLLADRTFGELTDADRAELDALLASEPEEATISLDRAAALASIALVSDDLSPLPDRLSRRIEAEAPTHLGPTVGSAIPRRRSVLAKSLPWLGWVAAASLLVVATIRPDEKPEGPPERPVEASFQSAPRSRLVATDHPLARGSSGLVAWDATRQAGYLALDGLAPVDPQRGTYQLWIFDATRDERYPVDGGTFGIGPGGPAIVPIRSSVPARRPTLFAITLEPPGGVVVSDRKRLLLTASWPD